MSGSLARLSGSKQLHPLAVKLAKKYVDEYGASVISIATSLATERHDDIVMQNHIDEAVKMIRNEKKRSWTREFVTTLGGVFLGTFLSGFIAELSTGNTFLIIVYTTLGFIGLFMILWGLLKR